MKIIECVNEVFLGTNKKEDRHTVNDKVKVYDLLTIKSVNNKFINKNALDKFESIFPLDKKFLTKENDIIICSRPPYNVVLIDKKNEGILVPSNFIILRDSNINANYLYNYLNLIGIKMKSNIDDSNVNIKISDIEDLNIKVDDKIIKNISDITNRINKRQEAYGKLIDNDQELIKMIFEKEGVIKDE